MMNGGGSKAFWLDMTLIKAPLLIMLHISCDLELVDGEVRGVEVGGTENGMKRSREGERV
jgi:hypothetical protein